MFIVMVALRFMTIWPLIQREISDSIYTFSAFYIAESLVTQIFATVLPLCYAIITYPLFGLRMEWISLFNYCWILIACASLCLSIGYLVRWVLNKLVKKKSKFSSSFSPNVDFTIALLPAGIVPMVVMCGYLINVDNIPAYVVPVRWLSWYAHLNELLQANQ